MSNLKHIIFGIAIALISVFFFAYAVQTIYPTPKYGDFCNENLSRVNFDSKAECEAVGGLWDGFDEEQSEVVVDDGDIPPHKSTYIRSCDTTHTCRENYNEARKSYERNVFFVHLIIGVIILLAAFFLGLEVVSTGLMGGAVLLIVYGTIRYWEGLSDIWRTLVLGFTLAILIGFAYKKLKD